MYTYDKVAKNIGPKKEALAQAEGELAVVQSELGKKQEALRKVGKEGGGWRCRSGAYLVVLHVLELEEGTISYCVSLVSTSVCLAHAWFSLNPTTATAVSRNLALSVVLR